MVPGSVRTVRTVYMEVGTHDFLRWREMHTGQASVSSLLDLKEVEDIISSRPPCTGGM
jgi:hypothetical protein